MKTQIIRLDPHDDVISARDKMGWSQTGRILLVWPERGGVLNKRLDLVLLQRHSKQLGAQLALITRDPEVRFCAAELGVPVYKDLRQAQRSHWRVDRRKHPTLRSTVFQPGRQPADLDALHKQAHPDQPVWLNTLPARLGFFAIGILALLSIAAIIFPAADIQLTPTVRQQEIDLIVRANPELDSINLAGDIPARLSSITVQGSGSLEARGSVNIPQDSAYTSIQLTNLTDQDVVIPEGVILRTSGDNPIRFETTRGGLIPAGPGTSTLLPARSLDPGIRGNIPADHLTIIEGPKSTHVSVTNPSPAQGGTDVSTPAPTSSQREQLHAALIEQLTQVALLELEQRSIPDELPVTPTLTLTQVLDTTFSPAEGLPGDELYLDLTLVYQVYTVSQDDLKELATAILDANLEDGYLSIPSTLRISALDTPVFGEDGLARWNVKAQREIREDILENTASRMVLGLTPAQAIERLRSELNLETAPHVRMLPNWWPRMPLVPFRITVRESVTNP